VSSKKVVTLHFYPKRSGAGIPINLLYKRLTALQRALLSLGEYQVLGELRERGRLPENVLGNYTLEVVAFKPGCLSVSVVLSGDQQVMFPKYDPAKQWDTLLQTIENVFDRNKVQTLIPDTILRKRVLRNIRELAPDKEIPQTFVGNIALTEKYKAAIDEMLMPSSTEKECELTGPVVEVKLIDEPYFGVATAQGLKRFPLRADFCDSMASALANVVTVKYTAGIDEARKETVSEIIDIIPMEGNTFPADEIVAEGNRFFLNESINIHVSVENTLLVLENEKLGIVAYASKFDQAWESFQEDFVFLWKEIAQEKDVTLETNAKNLKKYLLKLVEKTSEEVNCA